MPCVRPFARVCLHRGSASPRPNWRTSSVSAESHFVMRCVVLRWRASSILVVDAAPGSPGSARPTSPEIYEMRLILETRCTQYAVEALADGDMERVIGLSVEMDREDLSPLDGFTARRSFYADLYRWAGRPRMRRTVLQLRDNVDRYHILSDLAHSHEAHEELRTRIRAGDGVGAAAVAKAHLEEARDDLLAAMEQNGSTEADDE